MRAGVAGNSVFMIDSKRKFAAVAISFAIGLGGLGVAGCGDDDNEGVVEDAGQELEEAGEDAGNAADEAGEDIESEADDKSEDSGGGSGY